MNLSLRPPRVPLASFVSASRPPRVGALPDAFDPRASYPTPYNQIGNSCEAAYARGPWIAQGCQGEEPSHLAAYTMARLRERAFATQPLPDQGCNDADMLGALGAAGAAHAWGLVPGSVWPDDPSKLGTDLPFDVFQAAIPLKPGDVALVTGFGADLVAAVQAHAFARQPVAFTMAVDDAFMAMSGATAYTGPKGPTRGLHKQLAAAWRPSTTGSALPDIGVLGSWGTAWADGGWVWLSGDFFASSTFDHVACLSGPVFS